MKLGSRAGCIRAERMNLSRWISLTIIAFCLVMWLYPRPRLDASEELDERDSSSGKQAVPPLLFLGFVCTWWPDVLGEALWVGRGAWNPRPSSERAMKLLGWIFLIVAILLSVAGDRMLGILYH